MDSNASNDIQVGLLSLAAQDRFSRLFQSAIFVVRAEIGICLYNSDRVIERCTKDEYSQFGSRLRSNRDSNGEYKIRDRKRHPCNRFLEPSIVEVPHNMNWVSWRVF